MAQVLGTAVSVVIVVLLLVVLRELLRDQPMARFWALGVALSMVPLCAAFPMDRLLVFPGIGAFGLLAMLLESQTVWFWKWSGVGGWRRRVAAALLVLHGPLAAVLLTGRMAALPAFGELFRAGALHSPSGPGVEDQTFVYVNGNDFSVVYTRIIRIVEGRVPAPRRVVQLASMASDNTVLREDGHTLVVTPEDGFLASTIDRLLASPERSFAVGEVIERPDYLAEVRSISSDGRPSVVAFRFHKSLEDRGLRWLYWKDAELIEFPLPAVGQHVVVEANFPVG